MPPNRVFPGHRVSITGAGFDPDRVEVRAGATVTFTNSDDGEHTVVIAFADPASLPVAPGESVSVVVGGPPGEYAFRTEKFAGALKIK